MATKRTGTPAAKRSAGASNAGRKATSPMIAPLQTQVANSVMLYLNYKHYHWQSYGPHFRDLHLMFDEFSAAVLATVDEFAERIRMLGGNPIYSPADITSGSSVPVAAASGTMRDMLAEARAAETTVIAEQRAAADAAGEAGDPGTADLFTRVVQIHEKQLWFIRQALADDDEL